MNLSTVITLLAHYSDDAEFVDATVDLLNSTVWKRWQTALNKEESILTALAPKDLTKPATQPELPLQNIPSGHPSGTYRGT